MTIPEEVIESCCDLFYADDSPNSPNGEVEMGLVLIEALSHPSFLSLALDAAKEKGMLKHTWNWHDDPGKCNHEGTRGSCPNNGGQWLPLYSVVIPNE